MKLNSLQLLRAVAVSLVVYVHSVDLQMSFSVSRQQNFFYLQNFGAIGVDLFFVISGFVITLVANRYVGAAAGWEFLVKRFLRINPLYYLASLIYLVFALVPVLLHNPGSRMIHQPWHKALQTLFIFPLHPVPTRLLPLLTIGWTLSFEWLFYGLFFLLIIGKSRRKPLLLVVLVTTLVLAGYLARFHDNRLIFMTTPLLLEFLLGVLICRVYTGTQSIPVMAAMAFLLVGAGTYAYEIFNGFGYVSELQFILDGSLSLQRFLLWGLPSSLLVMGCVFLEKKQVFTRLWNNKWIRLTGDASYSIYLVHIIVFSMLSQVYKRIKWHALPDLSIFLQLALAIAAGIAFYRWVEKPLLKRLQRKPLKPALAAAPGTVNPL